MGRDNHLGGRVASRKDVTWDDCRARPVVFSRHSGRTNSVASTPDGRILITSGEDRVVRLWEPADLREAPVVLRGHEETVHILGILPDGPRLASYDDNGVVMLWHLSLPDLIALACRTAGRHFTTEEVRDFLGEGPSERPCLDQPKLSE